jgi:hypothetical protein
MFKRIHVIYSSNPLSYETVSFDIDVPTKHVASMACQLAGSVLLMFILAFCLWYQMKTIMIQKRIDGIRHEFMKNMIYEMKQPSSSSEDEEAIRIGDIDFIYAINELHHGNERVIITSRQAEILRILAERRGELVTREDILDAGVKTPTNIPLYWSVVDLLSQDRLSFQPKPFMLFLKTGTRQ